MFGRSFNDIGAAIIGRITDINKAFQTTDDLVASIKDSDSILKRLYPSKESIKEQLIDVDNLIPEINENKFDFDGWINELNSVDKQVKAGTLSWQDYSSSLKDNQKWIAKWGQETEGQIRTQSDLVKANQQARASALAHNEAIKAQTISAKAGKAALQALASAGNMIVMWGINEAVQLLYDCVTASDRLQESAENLGRQFTSTQSNIDNYKTKISELYSIINDSASSYEDAYNARNKLLEIQNEMIDQYGSEAESVRLVTNAINGQAEALDLLSKKQWDKIVDKFNYDPDKRWTEKLGDTWSNWISGSSNNYERMQKEMEDTSVSFHVTPKLNDKVYQEFTEKITDIFGAKVTSGFDSFTHTYRNSIFLSGDLDDIYNKLYNIRSLAKNMGLDDSYINVMSEQLEKTQNKLSNYQNLYNQSILQDRILADAAYEQSFKDINDAYRTYQEAFASGNTTAIEKAKQSFAEVVQNAANGVADDSIVDFFVNMYPELKDSVSGWLFEVHFKAAIDDDTDHFENDVYDAVSKFNSAEDILNFDPGTAIDDQITAHAVLQQMADDCKTDIDGLIARMQELGIVASKVKEDLRNKLSDGTQDLVIDDWINGLTNEEAILADSAAFDEALECQKAKLDGASLSAENYSTALDNVKTQQNALNAEPSALSISDTVTQLNTRLKPALTSLHSAYQNIFTDDGFKPDHVNADMLDSVKSAISQLNSMEDVAINIDSSAFKDFAQVLCDTSSTSDDVKKQFDQLANTIVYAAGSAAVNVETFDVLSKSLEAMGLSNARDVLEQIIQTQQEFNAVSEELGLTLEQVADATYEDTVQMLAEAQSANLNSQALWKLAVVQGTITDGTITTESNVDALLAEAKAAGLDAAMLTALENVKNGNIKDTNAAQAIMEQARQSILSSMNDFKLDFDFNPASSAASAGAAAGASYTDAFEEELQSLDNLRDRGVIDEKEYLTRLRALYEHYFKDKAQYAEQYAKYERQYLDGMKSLYDSALSGVSKLMSHQIDGYTEAKESAVASLEAEKEARLEAIEVQKEQLEAEQDLIDERIDAKQELIDGIQKEIDAMKEARAERQRQIDLQKAQYNLESMKNQRTILQYSREKGLHYVADESAIRDAQEKVDEAEFDIEVARKENEIRLIEQEIDLLEEQKEAIQDQISALDGQSEQIEEYYSKMIAETEKYYDTLISNTEKQKSKWEELAEVEEIAQAYSSMKQVFGDMGYTVQDILNGNEQAFEDFKSRYISLLNDLNNNSSFAEGLSYASGISEESLDSFLGRTKDAGAGIDELSAKSSSLSVVAEGMGTIANSASGANTQISETAANVGNVVANMGELGSHLDTVNTLAGIEQAAFDTLLQTINNVIDAINQKTQAMLNEQAVTGIAVTTEIAYFILLKEKILELQECISKINLTVMTLDRTPVDNLTDAFQHLYHQILLISTTLGMGGEDQTTGSLGGIMSALQALNEISLEKGIIAQLTNLQAAILGVASAISGGSGKAPEAKGIGNSAALLGGGKTDGKNTDAKGGGNSITNAITQMGETANEVIGAPDAEGDGTVIGEFGSMKTSVTNVTAAIGSEDSDGTEERGEDSGDETDGTLIDSIVSLGDTTKKVLGEPGGEGVIGRFEQFHQPISDADAHVQSIAKGLEHIDGQNVECTIKIHVESDGSLPSGITQSTEMNTGSGEYTPVYNKQSSAGQAHNPIITPDGLTLHPVRSGDSPWALQQSFAPLLQEMNRHLAVSAMYEHRRQTEQMIRDITATNMIYNNSNIQPAIHGGVHITCPGVTSQEVARQVGAELNHMFNGLHNYADQQSSVR